MKNKFPDTSLDSQIHYCARHPQRDTELRCNRCERYMCVECAKRTPVGYTCRQCVRGHEDRFFEGGAIDYGLVAATGAVAGALLPILQLLVGGFVILGFLVAPAIGGAAAQIALQLTGRRRGRYSGYLAGGGLLAGGFASALLLAGGLGLFTFIYLALASSAAYARFKVSI